MPAFISLFPWLFRCARKLPGSTKGRAQLYHLNVLDFICIYFSHYTHIIKLSFKYSFCRKAIHLGWHKSFIPIFPCVKQCKLYCLPIFFSIFFFSIKAVFYLHKNVVKNLFRPSCQTKFALWLCSQTSCAEFHFMAIFL